MMCGEGLLCRYRMTLNWAYLALLCQILVLQQVSGLLSTATRQPTSTNLRKIHTGRAGRAALSMLHYVRLASLLCRPSKHYRTRHFDQRHVCRADLKASLNIALACKLARHLHVKWIHLPRE